jgi:SAM-dependent methyltransferase
MAHEFDGDGLFGEDYLHFYASVLGDERSDADTDAVVARGALEAGMRVLDAPCGHGRIAVRLAERGIHVTGVDLSPAFLDVARGDAAARGVEVDFVEGDMRRLPVDGPFDAVVSWFTSFGYFGDDDNLDVLREYRRVLAPGGTLVLETLSHDGYVRTFTESPDAIVVDVDGDLMVDRNHFDVDSGCIVCHRVTFRGTTRRETRFFIRLLTIPEWRTWLEAAGFSSVTFSDAGGEDVDVDTFRIVVRAEA